MILKIKTLADIASSEITPEWVYQSRRRFLQVAATGAAGAVAGSLAPAAAFAGQSGPVPTGLAPLSGEKTEDGPDPAGDPITSYDILTTYNNYYEFGTLKNQPAKNAGRLTVKPWTVKVDGLVNKPGN